MKSLMLVIVACSLTACSSASSPLAPATIPPAVPPLTLTDLHAYYAPLEVFPGSDTQIHVGTFHRRDDGSFAGVNDIACTFATESGTLTMLPTGADREWHVALLSIPRNAGLGDRTLHVTAQCAELAATLAVYVSMEGSHMPGPTPPGATGGGTGTTPPTTPPTTPGTRP